VINKNVLKYILLDIMKNYLAFISGFLSFAGFIIYKDRKDFNRLTKEIEETNKKIKDEQDSHFAKFTKTK